MESDQQAMQRIIAEGARLMRLGEELAQDDDVEVGVSKSWWEQVIPHLERCADLERDMQQGGSWV